MITITHRGSLQKTGRYLSNLKRLKVQAILERYGREGVDALAASTPKDSGATAAGWTYQVRNVARGYQLTFTNRHEENGVYPALLIQYGHGTGTGGYVPPRDYINPTLSPIFNTIVNAIEKEIKAL